MILPSHRDIRFSPRNWDFTGMPKSAATNCTGSFFEFSLNVNLDPCLVRLFFDISSMIEPLPIVAITLDGGPLVKLPSGPEVCYAIEDVRPGNHLVRVTLVNLNENVEHWKKPFQSGLIFNGLTFDGGELGAKPKTREGQAMFIGDSITQGVRSRNGSLYIQHDDCTIGYSTLTADALGYDLVNVGFGRQGVAIVGNGGIPMATESVGYICDGVPVSPGFQPNLIVINLGSNDALNGIAQLVFIDNYKTMLQTLRYLHREAVIVCLIPFGGFYGDGIKQAAAGFGAETGDTNIKVIDGTSWIIVNTQWQPTLHTTDGIHPNEKGHKRASDALVEELVKLMM